MEQAHTWCIYTHTSKILTHRIKINKKIFWMCKNQKVIHNQRCNPRCFWQSPPTSHSTSHYSSLGSKHTTYAYCAASSHIIPTNTASALHLRFKTSYTMTHRHSYIQLSAWKKDYFYVYWYQIINYYTLNYTFRNVWYVKLLSCWLEFYLLKKSFDDFWLGIRTTLKNTKGAWYSTVPNIQWRLNSSCRNK